MHAFENTVTIQRPAEEVFAFLADFENIPAWNYAIDETRKISAGPVGVGRQIGPFRATIGYELEASPEGTRLVNAVQLDASQARLRLAAPLAMPRIKAAVAQNLGKLRLVLEGSRTA